jgi:hypothetical protein
MVNPARSPIGVDERARRIPCLGHKKPGCNQIGTHSGVIRCYNRQVKSWSVRLVKHWLMVLAILVTIAACTPAEAPNVTPASGTVVHFDAPSTPVAAGSTFTAKVQLDRVKDLVGDEVQISFNPAILEVQDADPAKSGVEVALGAFLKPDYVAQNLVTAEQGRINFSVVQLPPSQPVSGSGILATVTFKAKAAGSSPLTFDLVNLADAAGTPIDHAVQNSQVFVK